MHNITEKKAPIHVIVHYPKTAQGRLELSAQVAHAHAEMIIQQIKKQHCPVFQKEELLDAVIASVKEKSDVQQ